MLNSFEICVFKDSFIHKEKCFTAVFAQIWKGGLYILKNQNKGLFSLK